LGKPLAEKKDLGLYIHIPFCVKKCDYCDFLSTPANEATKGAYIKSLIAEIKSHKDIASEYLVKTIFIGGGTPSSIEGNYIADILEAVKDVFTIYGINDNPIKKQGLFHKIFPGKSSNLTKQDYLEIDKDDKVEITLEANPGTLSKEKLLIYKDAGINRLSIGLQSADNDELKVLGRIHTFEEFQENYLLARELGFQNINVDLMSALPGQTMEDWMNTLEKVVALNPEHISAYSLILEEGTPFYQKYNEEDQDEDLDREIYAVTKEYLENKGYHRYEISNYAKTGFECRHNSSYWTRIEYLGIGLGASSLLHNVRFHNETNMKEYMEISSDNHKRIKNIERLDIGQQMEEFMFLGLRMSDGISKDKFKAHFHKAIETIYGDVINQSVREGLLDNGNDRIYLTDKGIDLSNVVMSRFLLDEAKRNK
jgi:oxygen-independent coproporphyrinogen-3 oxidase